VRDNEGNSRGFAYVDVSDSFMIEEACKLHGTNLKGTAISIKKADPPSAKDKCDRTVFVNNLPTSITEQKLHGMFKIVCTFISMEI
jgi:RNA recognition motif-containing protein